MFGVDSFSVCPDSLISEISKISKCEYLLTHVFLCSVQVSLIGWLESNDIVACYTSITIKNTSNGYVNLQTPGAGKSFNAEWSFSQPRSSILNKPLVCITYFKMKGVGVQTWGFMQHDSTNDSCSRIPVMAI